MLRKLFTIAAMICTAVTVTTLTGCNTVAGAGKDVEKGGEAIHDTAKDVQKKM